MSIKEQESIDTEQYQLAHEIALEGNKQLGIIEQLFKQYFTNFGNEVTGFPKVQKLFEDFCQSREIFYKINEIDPLELEKAKNISE
jgi:hypothetical protein